jgi:leucyl-tRNA synthetase
VWKLATQNLEKIGSVGKNAPSENTEADRKLLRKTHQTIRKVTVDIDQRMHHNTGISAIMELVNLTLEFASDSNANSVSGTTLRLAIETIVHLLNPFAPHLTEELWTLLGHRTLLSMEPWPSFDAELAREEQATVVVQINGKFRGSIQAAPGSTQEQIYGHASQDERIRKHLENKQVRKIIFVPDKLINIVVQ